MHVMLGDDGLLCVQTLVSAREGGGGSSVAERLLLIIGLLASLRGF
jgi:hypothetical protein